MDKVCLAYAARAGGTAPVWTAYEAGIFRKLSIDLELMLIPGSKAVAQSLDEGRIELANFASPAAVQRNLQYGSDLVVLLGVMNRLTQTISGRPGIETLEQLRGGRIGVPGLEEVDYRILQIVLPRIGFTPGVDVHIVDIGRSGHDRKWLGNPEVDALVLHPPAPSDAEQAGWKILLDMRDLNLPFQLACITAKRAWVAGHADVVERYIRGHVEGLFRFLQDPEFALKVMTIYSDTTDEAVLRQGYDVLRSVFSRNPYPPVEAMANVVRTFEGLFPGAGPERAPEFIDDRYIAALDRSGELERLRRRYGIG